MELSITTISDKLTEQNAGDLQEALGLKLLNGV
jgi:hypothetical protein